jgi:hypothetical protein
MGAFRRFVMALAGISAVFLIIIATIAGGFAGAAASALISGLLTGHPGPGNAVIGFLLGAATGFFFAALPATMMFTLTEIAENTRVGRPLERALEAGWKMYFGASIGSQSSTKY